MTAANEKEFQDRHRRLGRLLAFLTAFLFVVIVLALAGRFRWLGAGDGFTFFDQKGILTGPGTFLVLIGAALSALTVFVAYKRLTLRREFLKQPTAPKTNAKAVRAFGQWLATDVLAGATCGDVGSQRIEGIFRGRKFTVEWRESESPARVRYSTESDLSAFSMRVWWTGKARAESPAATTPSQFATHDTRFETCCAWQSASPVDALKFLNQSDVSGTLHRLCFLSGRKDDADDETGVFFENGRIGCVARAPSFDFMRAPSALVFFQDLLFLADAADGKSARPLLAGTETFAADPTSAQQSTSPAKRPSKIMSLLSCLMFVVFILVPLAALWIAGSYYCAKWLDMSAGMLCFFVPVLLMAIFVFTRPTLPSDETDGVNDMETVRAAAMKYWEQRLRGDPQCATLLDSYERRVKND